MIITLILTHVVNLTLCFRLLAGELESWLQMMLRWSPKERGKDFKQRSKDSQDGAKDSEEDSKESSSEAGKDSPKASCFCFDELSRILNLKVDKAFVEGMSIVSRVSMSNAKLSLSPQLVHVLNMTSAEIFTYSVQRQEDVASLQERIAQDARIPPATQELLLEAGLALEPHNSVMQCAIDYSVCLMEQNFVFVF